jgi:hypothetical protein
MYTDGDKDKSFGFGQLECALNRSVDAEHGYSHIVALPIETQARVSLLGLFDKLTARWSR